MYCPAKILTKSLILSGHLVWDEKCGLDKNKKACSKTRNTETKPPERNLRSHRNNRNENTGTTGTTETTETKPAEQQSQLKGVKYRPQVLLAALILTYLSSQAKNGSSPRDLFSPDSHTHTYTWYN